MVASSTQTESAFNPSVPKDQEPTWWHWSHGIQTPQADQSGKDLFESAGHVIKEGFSAADFLMKSHIEDQYRKEVDPIMEQYKSNLQMADASVRTGQAVPGTTRGTTKEGATPPDELKSLDGTLSTLLNAKANNKLSPTQYYAKLDSTLRQFRDRYPGYVDYIDHIAERVTGVKAANAYIQSLTQDINSFQTALKAEHEKIGTYLQHYTDKIPEAAVIYARWRKNEISDQEAITQLTPRVSELAQFHFNHAKYDQFKDDNERLKVEAERGFQTYVAQKAASRWDSIMTASGILQQHTPGAEAAAAGPGTGFIQSDAMKLADLLRQAQEGKITIKDEQWAQLKYLMDAHMLDFRKEMQNWANAPSLTGGQSHRAILGDRIDGIITSNMDTMNHAYKAITEKDMGLMFQSSTMANAQARSALTSLLGEDGLREALLVSGAVSHIAGPQASSVAFQQLAMKLNKLSDTAISSALFNRMLVQPDLRRTGEPGAALNPTGKATTLDETISQVRKGIDGPNAIQASRAAAKASEAIVDVFKQTLLDPKTTDEGKLNLIKGAFGQENNNLLNRFAQDKWVQQDNGQQRFVRGKYSIYSSLTSDDVAQQVFDLAKKHDPQIWVNYRNWVTESFGTNLFRQELLSLKDAQIDPNVEVRWENDRFEMRIGRDMNALYKHVPFSTTRPFVQADEEGPGYQRLQESLRRLNMGLGSLSSVFSRESKDPGQVGASLLQTMHQYGIPMDNIRSIPGAIGNAIIHSIPRKEETKE